MTNWKRGSCQLSNSVHKHKSFNTDSFTCLTEKYISHHVLCSIVFPLCSLSTHFITAAVYRQQQCVRASLTLWTRKNAWILTQAQRCAQLFFCFRSKVKVLSHFNQQLPKTEIRLVLVTYSRPTHVRNCEKVWKRHVTRFTLSLCWQSCVCHIFLYDLMFSFF